MNNNTISQEDAIKKVKSYGDGLYLRGGKAGQVTSLVCNKIIESIKSGGTTPQQASERVDKIQTNWYLKSRGRFS